MDERSGGSIGGMDEGRSLHLYLREIAKVPLLDREEEVDLARRSREGDPEAREALVRANLRFVVSVAKRYRNQGLSFSDLIDEGNLGLLEAVRRFDERRGNRFISYAVWWIKQSILKALAEQARMIRIPLGRAGTVQRILRETEKLRQAFGREPTDREVAEAVALSEAEIRETLNAASRMRSLDAPENGPDGESSLRDFLEDTLSPAPDTELIETGLRREVGRALRSLGPREEAVLRSYFGFDSDRKQTLEEIGKKMKLSRERVRQIKDQAIRRLRQSARGDALKSYLAS
ncbi:MAG: sigma-70 family RNA polymerase sigma factor [Candidatus Eisenbacteria bacterium]|nr:sigma-70 family RNA polymerase sigma factor [Candidatus Eisenbacteria bacterium]